jgi:hypothetical protein
MWEYRLPKAVLLQWRTVLGGYAAAEVCFQAWRWYHYSSISEQLQEKPSVAAVPAALDRFFTLHGTSTCFFAAPHSLRVWISKYARRCVLSSFSLLPAARAEQRGSAAPLACWLNRRD